MFGMRKFLIILKTVCKYTIPCSLIIKNVSLNTLKLKQLYQIHLSPELKLEKIKLLDVFLLSNCNNFIKPNTNIKWVNQYDKDILKKLSRITTRKIKLVDISLLSNCKNCIKPNNLKTKWILQILNPHVLPEASSKWVN